MKIEIRDDSILIDGYVNAVERYSKPLYDTRGKFIEKIMPTVFQRAIEKSKNINVLLNHDKNRKLADTKSGKAKLYEDNIGLRATVEIDDEEVIEKAKEGKLRGWSFGFVCLKQNREKNKDGMEERTVREIELKEVSIIDDRKSPAYIGTSIEVRDDRMELIEYRSEDFESEPSTPPNENNFSTMTYSQKREILSSSLKKSFPEGWVEDFDDKYIYATIDNKCEIYKMGYLIEDSTANIDSNNKVRVIRGGYAEIRDDNLPEKEPEQRLEKEVEKIDYSNYKERLKKIKEEI